jgi:hypothetical protein
MAALLLIAAFTAYRMTRRTAKPLAEQGEYIKVPQTTQAAAEMDPRAPGTAAPHDENAANEE